MNRDIEIAVIGGSLVGPLTEKLLRSIGFQNVTTYEASPEMRPQAGGVIGVRETGFDALAQAQVPLSAIRAYPGKQVLTYNIDRRQVVGLRDQTTYPGETTAWDIFHSAVSNGVDIHFGMRVTDLAQDGTLTFGNDATARPDLILFADGRNSTGRRFLDPDRKLTYQNYLVWRGITDPNPDVVGFTRYRNDEHARLFSVTEPIIQGRHEGKTDWTYYHNLRGEDFTALVGADPTKRVFMLPHHFTPQVREFMLGQAQRHLPDPWVQMMADTDALMAAPINDVAMPTRAAWRRGRALCVLLGDALEPVRPHAGRGANNGIDQAWALTQFLDGADNLERALLDWQMYVLPRIAEHVELGLGRAQRNGFGIGQDGVLRV